MKTETERYKTQTFGSKPWTEGEDQTLLNALARHSDDWELIAKQYFPRVRTPADLISRYDWLLALDIAADAPPSCAKWSEKETQALCAAVQIHGPDWGYITNTIFQARRTENAVRNKWSKISSKKSAPPRINASKWTEEEIKTLIVAVSRVGTDWDLISREYFHSVRGPHSLMERWEKILNKFKVNLDCNLLQTSKAKAIARKLLECVGYSEIKPLSDNQKKKIVMADKSKVTESSMKPSASTKWTDNDIKKLRAAVKKHGTVWAAIVHEYFPSRTPEAVRKRWEMLLRERKKAKADMTSKPPLRVTRHSWKPAEIRKLRAAVAKHGENEWQLISTKYFNSVRSPEATKRKWREVLQTNVDLSDSTDGSVLSPSSDNDTSSDFSISSQRPWTEADSEILRVGVAHVGTDWKRLAHDFFYNNKTPNILSRRWNLIKNRFPKRLNKAVQTDSVRPRRASISSEQPKSVSRWRAWTEDEIKNLYIGIRRYGIDWAKIADKVFQKSRSAGALYCKWSSLENPPPAKKAKSITKKKISKTEHITKKTTDRLLPKKPLIVEDLWTDMELTKLREGVQNFRDDWDTIAENVFQGTRSPETLCSTWNALQTDALAKPWTEEEIEKLRAGFQKYEADWSRIAEDHFNGSRTPVAVNRCWELLRDKGVVAGSPTRANRWTEEEMKLLVKVSDECKQDWELISQKFFQSKRTSEALKRKYFNLMKSNEADETYHMPWSSEDHQTLLDAVEKHGIDWEFISRRYFNGARTARTLRRRYIVIMQKTSPDAGEVWSLNLRSGTKRWSSAETEKLHEAFAMHGDKWDYISHNYFSSKRSADYLRLKWEEIKPKISGPSSGRKCEKMLETTIKKSNKNEKRVENGQPSLPITAHTSGHSGNKWTEAETRILLKAVTQHGPNWRTISREVFGSKRTIFGLKARWKRICQDRCKNVTVKEEGEKCSDKERKLDKQKLRDNLRSTIRGYNAKTRLNRRGVKLAKRVRRVGEKWTEKETVKLWEAVTIHGLKWKKIAREYFNCERRPAALEGRWYRTRSRMRQTVPVTTTIGSNLNVILTQKPPSWTEADTERLRTGVRKFGKKWQLLAQKCFPSRTPSSLEKRWMHIRGDDPQAEEEDIEPDYDDEDLPVESTVSEEVNNLSCDSGTELELVEDEIETEEEDVGMASHPLESEQRNPLSDGNQQRSSICYRPLQMSSACQL
ncbi:6501_t:CDS:1 [Paraglomus occultum]|uniref:6501_t:CDS:1 n=1 Tax=Paraglomus occultum TaxID=144539 RepID=A0A9N8VKI2_9GLOM|nr:6501_t:CDS:1 [Paraglomus occultum]